MDISRLDSGKLKLKIEDLRVESLFESLGREFRLIAQGRHFRVSHSRRIIRTDGALFRRILQNFLSNAIRYTPTGGHILLGARTVGGRCRIEVWDTGCGIAANKTEEIFEEFRRLETGQTGVTRGVGLGLAIVRTIAKLLTQEVRVRSWPGQGSVFSVDALLGNAELLVPPPNVASLDQQRLHGRSVWCIDDDVRVREATRSVLERWGCRVTLCESREESLRVAEGAVAPDLLILDYRLPDGLGPDLIPDLNRIWGTNVPVVIVSGENSTLLSETLGDSPWPVMAKPIRPDELRTRLLEIVALASEDTI